MFQQEFDAHDALEDVLALKKILLSSALAIDTKTIVNNSKIHPARQAEVDMKYLDHRHQLLRTFTGTLYRPNDNQSPLSHGMAQKIAGSGLSYDDLFTLYSKFGKAGVIAVLSMEPTTSHENKQIRVTKNKKVLANIVAYLKSNAENL